MKRIAILTVLMFGAMVALRAQQPPKPATPVSEPVPQLTQTEKIAAQAILDKYKAAQQAMQDVAQMFREMDLDVQREHPGYHLDPMNPLNLIKDAPKPAPLAAAPKK